MQVLAFVFGEPLTSNIYINLERLEKFLITQYARHPQKTYINNGRNVITF